MGYDIYGEPLARGHCEVHPHVHEEYPCSVCLSEKEKVDKQNETGELLQRVLYLEGAESDYQNRILALEQGLGSIYAHAGEDTVIAEICNRLLEAKV